MRSESAALKAACLIFLLFLRPTLSAQGPQQADLWLRGRQRFSSTLPCSISWPSIKRASMVPQSCLVFT